ncbi:MAG: hypothetical protein IJW53_00805 [Clostridia bacterium]|nr:hypothetical protein [Clostridia bacterium]
MDFKNVDKKYRPIPFWSWNEKLDTEETKRQIGIMDEAGIGGYFMHARGGLLTEYMGEEWFDNVKASIEEGNKRGMHSWAYDENGWPSGFGGGKVNGLGDEYRQKSLHIEPLTDENKDADNTVLIKDGVRYFYRINEFYVDTLDKKVMGKFIEEIYRKYYDKFGSTFDGFFTDEPQILRGDGYPWSFILEESFKERYGYSLVEKLDMLFFDKEGCEDVRVDYWQLITDLFSDAFFKQIYDWCDAHGYKLTGHLVLEEDLMSQIVSNGACMPHYEYFHVPGMDWLGRPVTECLTPMQLSSASAQMGKKQILTETYAASGHNVSHGELKRILEWQMVHGVNLLCTHLEGYSLRGIRKRDYPPAMYYQQPWWADMKVFFDAMSRVGMLIAEGRVNVDTLLIHPETTAWTIYNGYEFSAESSRLIRSYHDSFLADMRSIEDKHVEYHLGDETLMRRHAKVENGELVIGQMRYKTIVLPTKYKRLLPNTEKLLDEFRKAGGRIISVSEVEPNDIMAPSRLSYTSRSFDGFDMHYIVNTDNSEITAGIKRGNKQMIIETGDLVPFSGIHTFAPYESLVLIDTHEEREEITETSASERLSLMGEWDVKSFTHNSLTLDFCDYYFNGELVEKEGYVLNILPRINALERAVALKQDYRFTISSIPSEIFLATETPEIFKISVNGKEIDKTDCGYFRDSAFRKLNIAPYVCEGENVITFESVIEQTPACYEHLSKSWTFESMKNCLSYDMEIEPIYIVGDFGLDFAGAVSETSDKTFFIDKQPIIAAKPTRVDAAKLDYSGFAEFAGELTLSREVELDSTDYHVMLTGRGMNAIRLSVNGEHVATKLYPPYRVELKDHLKPGKNILEVTVVNNLRNMMGPHHLKNEEERWVCPGSFYKESNIFNHRDGVGADCHEDLGVHRDGYLLVNYGLTE